MSNFLKSLFNKSQNPGKANSEQNAQANNTLNSQLTAQNVQYSDVKFGSHEAAARLRNLASFFSDNPDPQVKSMATEEALSLFLKEFYQYFSRVIASPNFYNMLGDRSSSNFIGQPSTIILLITVSLLDLLDVSYYTESTHNRSHVGGEILAGLPQVTVKRIQENYRDDLENVLDGIKCVALMPIWPHNCSVLSARVGQNFILVIFGLAITMITDIENYLNEISDNYSNGSAINVDDITESLSFRFKILLRCVHFIQNSCEGAKVTIDNILPKQPWNQANLSDMNLVLLKDKDVTPQEFLTLGRDSLDGNYATDKTQWFEMMICNGGRQLMFFLSNKLEKLQADAQLIYARLDSASGANSTLEALLFNTWTSILAVHCELAYSMSNLVDENKPALIQSFVDFDGNRCLHSMLSKSLPSQLIKGNDDLSLSLLLRRSLICIYSFKQLRSIQSSNIGNKMVCLNSASLGRFLGWCRSHFDTFDNANSAQVYSLFKNHSIECTSINNFLKPSYPVDFWPWSDGEQSRNTTADVHSFRLSKELRVPGSAPWYHRISSSKFWISTFNLIKYFVYAPSPTTPDSPDKILSLTLFKSSLSIVLSSIHKSTMAEVLPVHSTQIVRSESKDGSLPAISTLHCPTFQMHMLEFVEYCFKTFSVASAAVFSEISVTTTFLSQNFMFHTDIADQIASFDISTQINEAKNIMTVRFTAPRDINGALICAKIEVNDRIFSFLELFWQSKIMSSNHSSEPALNEDILTVLLVICNTQRKFPPEYIILQVIRWLHSIVIALKHDNFREVVVSNALISSVEVCFRLMSRMGISKFEPSSLTGNLDFEELDRKRPLLWPARSSLLTFIQYLTNQTVSFSWLQVFLDDSPAEQDSLIVYSRSSTTDSGSSESSESWNRSITSSSDSSGDPSRKASSKQTKATSKGIQRAKYVSLFILEPKSRAVSLELLMNIISLCAENMVGSPTTSTKSATGSGDSSKYNQLVLEIIGNILDIVGFAKKYPSFCDGNNAAITILRSLTWIFRSEFYIRSKLQDIASQGNFVSHVLFSLTQYSRSSDSKTNQDIKSVILRQSLAFLTSCMCCHEGNKNEFSAILSYGQGKSDSQSAASEKKSKYLSFDSVKNTILHFEPGLSMETIVVLFDMALEEAHYVDRNDLHSKTLLSQGLFSNLTIDRPKIKNISAVALIFGLLTSCDDDSQGFILKTFKNLLTGRASLANLSACTRSHPRLLDLALDLFPAISEKSQMCNVELVQMLGRYGISVSQLKHLFQILQSKDENRPAYTWLVLKALRGMFSDYDGPRHTFVFDGEDSGLWMPPIYRWPTKKGMSFCVWLCIEAPETSTSRVASISRNKGPKALEYRPYILSMRNSQGFGCELFLKSTPSMGGFQVTLRWYNGSGDSPAISADLENMTISEGKWHFVAFSVSPSSSFYTKEEAILVVDDQHYKSRLNVSKLPENIMEPMIGDISPRFHDQLSEFYKTAMRGQLGATYFFGEALTETQLLGIKELGPEYFYSFEPFSADYLDHSKKSTSTILDGSLSSHLVLAYNPTVWKGDFFLDNTPVKNEIKWRINAGQGSTNVAPSNLVPEEFLEQIVPILDMTSGTIKMHARRRPGTEKSSKQDIRMALDALGGLKTILPLFLQFDQPRMSQTHNSNALTTKGSLTNDTSFDANFCPSLLELLVTLFSESENHLILRKIGGISLMVYFLERVSPRHFTESSLKLFMALFDISSAHSQTQDIILERIFCNFKMWVFTSPSVQLKLLDWLLSYVKTNTKRFRETIGIRRIVESLYWYYENDVCGVPLVDIMGERVLPGSVAFTEFIEQDGIGSMTKYFPFMTKSKWVHPITGEVCGEVPTGENLATIRSKFFDLYLALIPNQILPEDIESIIGYLGLTTSAASKLEVIDLIFNLLSNSTRTGPVLLALACTNSIQSLYTLFYHPNISVRISAVCFMAKILNVIVSHQVLPEIPMESQYAKLQPKVSNPSNAINALKSDDGAASSFALSLKALKLQGQYLSILLQMMQSHVLDNFETCDDDTQEVYFGFLLSAYFSMLFNYKIDDLYDEFKKVFKVENGKTVCKAAKSSDAVLRCMSFKSMESRGAFSRPIQIPVMITAILSTLKRSNIPTSYKLESLNVILKTLPFGDNGDLFLRAPDWSLLLLELISMEKSTNASKATKTSQDILNTAQSILNTALSHAMMTGRSLTDESIIINSEGTSERGVTEIMKEISRGERVIGADLCREIIVNYESLVVTQNPSNNSRDNAIFALSIIDMAVTALGNRDKKEKGNSEIVKTYADKLMHANVACLLLLTVQYFEAVHSMEPHDLQLLIQTLRRLIDLTVTNIKTPPDWMVEDRTVLTTSVCLESDSIVSLSSIYPQSFVLRKRNNSNNFKPLSFANGGVCWSSIYLFIRLLQFRPEGEALAFIVDNLIMLFRASWEVEADCIEFETFHIVLSLMQYVPVNNAAARKLIIEMVHSSRQVFRAFIASCYVVQEKNLSVSSINQLVSNQVAVDFVASLPDKNSISLQDATQTIESSMAKSASSMEAFCVLVFNTILFPESKLPISADVLKIASQLVSDEVKRIENLIIQSRMAELNFKRDFSSVKEALANKRKERNNLIREYSSLSLTWFSRILNDQLVNLKDSIRTYDLSCRRNEAKWNAMWQELANERGPWGIVGTGDLEVFWTLDMTENNNLMRMRLRRNEYGTRHNIATKRAVGKNRELENAANSTNNIADAGLWKDLMKYKKKNASAEIVDENEDMIVNEDEEVVSEETIGPTGGQGGLTDDGRSIMFSTPAEVITVASSSAGARTPGSVELGKNKFMFTRQNEQEMYNFTNKSGNPEFVWACQAFPTSTWQMGEIVAVSRRRYLQQNIAVEILFSSRKTVFFNLFDSKAAKKLYKMLILKIKPPNVFQGNSSPTVDDCLLRTLLPGTVRNMTQAWVHREISNFEYIMYLNALSGRTFNDLSQYPVFPWVIADYSSRKLDLRDPKIYRDFEWPMGAQTSEQREMLREKYDNLTSLDDCPPYHNGSHYSTSGFVLWYLIRLEPFTSLHVWLQDGKFDKPDRLFYSIEAAYRGCTTNIMDVKELIPEFFFNPDFLENVNSIDLGTMQNGKKIGPVQLPPWARNAHDFVRINREALESDHVSRHLHHWIDLIFGYKQRPPHLGGDQASVEYCNVFSHWSYVNAVDLEELRANNPQLFQTALKQIDCFGQTPMQLFDKPHPERQSFDKADIIWPIASVIEGVNTIVRNYPLPEKPQKILCFDDFKMSPFPIIFIHEMRGSEKLVTVDSSRLLGTHVFKVQSPDVVPPYIFKMDPLVLKSSGQSESKLSNFLKTYNINSIAKDRRVGVPFASQGLVHEGITPSDRYNPDLIGRHENKVALIEDETERIRKRDRTRDKEKKDAADLEPISTDLTSGASTPSTPSSPGQLSIMRLTLGNTDSADPESRSRSMSKSSSARLTNAGLPTNSQKVRSRARGNLNFRRQPVDDHISSRLFGILPDHKLLFSCGHWDNSFKVTHVDSGSTIQSVLYHRDVVTCLCVAQDFSNNWVIVGSRDCTVSVWEVFPERESNPINTTPQHVLCGHDSVINCLAVNSEIDIIVSGSDDGTIIMYTLREGIYLRSLYFGIHQSVPTPSAPVSASGASTPTSSAESKSSSTSLTQATSTPISNSNSNSNSNSSSATVSSTATSRTKRRVHMICVSRECYIVAYSMDGNVICTYSVNGRLLRMIDVGERLHCMCLSEDGKVLLTGGERCLVVLRWVATLFLADNGARKDLEAVLDGNMEKPNEKHAEGDNCHRFTSPIRSLYLTQQERHLVVGLESGDVRILAQDSEYLRRRLHKKLMEIGILPQSDTDLM